ncbi:hypothetical protein [Paenibacillus sp. Root52]|uniref:hypothetical protein n=1 Tax=Paenibacillus sp. Root52 TaxID=1736552 RepID=UPI000B202E38|nr:hypothetical protein [Paenibacillus sp. Root52]
MTVTGKVWLALTRDERLICLEFAAYENAKRQARIHSLKYLSRFKASLRKRGDAV